MRNAIAEKYRYLLLTVAASLICLAITLYWLVTLLYVTPNNPVRIIFQPQLSEFERVAYQKWNFFAPPGRVNNRLYYRFLSPVDGGTVRRVEVLEPIWKRKQANHPFNEGSEVIDYIVAGSADMIQNEIRELFQYRAVVDKVQDRAIQSQEESLARAPAEAADSQFDPTDFDREKEGIFHDMIAQTLDPIHNQSGPLRTLVKYSVVLASDLGINNLPLRCQMEFIQIDIPRFVDRYQANPAVKSRMIFRTAVFDVPVGNISRSIDSH